MAIHFTCPHCGASQTAEDRFAGLTGPCTSCGKQMSVPGGSGAKGMSTGTAVAAGAGAGSILLVVGIVSLVVLLMCGGILVALLLPAVQAARHAARRQVSMNNEKNIMLAMHNYMSTYGEFPPAYLADKDGKPMHSWRVLILPFIEQQNLYNQYDMSKPWDSPENMQVANTMPATYRSPLDTDNKPNSNITSYLLFAGKGSVFDGKEKITFASFPDGLSNTLALCEVDNSGVVWTQPTDLDAEKLDFIIHSMKDQRPGQIYSAASGGTITGMFDGSVRFISDKVAPEMLRSAVDPKDGTPVMLD